MNLIPRLRFQTKLFFSNILLTVLACSILGVTVSKVSSEIFLRMFLDDKKNLIVNISELIDGKLHSSFSFKKVTETPEYNKLLNFFVDLSKREQYITWIYSINYTKDTDEFTYAIDPSITEYDTVWIESKFFGFEVYRTNINKLIVKWNDLEYSDSFTVIFKDFKSHVKIEQGEIGKIYINGTLILNVPTIFPIYGEIHGVKIDESNDNYYLDKNLGNDIPYIRYTYSRSGKPSSIPGTPWEETDEFKSHAREALKDCEIYFPDKPNPIIYGNYYNMIAPIKNENGSCSGIIIFAFSDRVLKIFKSSLEEVIFLISTITLLLSILISYLLSRTFSRNIKEMLGVVSKISSGELNKRIQMNTKDEFEDLAKNFNSMVDSLQDSMFTSQKLNLELKDAIRKEEELSASLERKVIERTKAQEEAYKELKASQNHLIQSEKMAALGQLIAGIAHEINTPIGAIKASAGNIKLSLIEIIKQSPSIFKNLDENNIHKLSNFISRLGTSTETLSTKEERKAKKEISSLLEQNGVSEPEEIAQILVEIKVRELHDTDLELFRHPISLDLVKYIYNFGGLKIKANTIETAVDKTSKIVYALKSYSHRDHTGNKQKTNIINGIETVLVIYQNYLKQGIEITKKYDEDIPEVLCFSDELNQVWTNLIHNSIQAMKNKGKIDIIVRRNLPDKTISVLFHDSGPGIPIEIIDKIFEPFYTTKNAGEGSGLGLHICKQIIDKHSGDIKILPVSEGACFEVVIPLD
jgi:two-component system, NtrC family, sensor kinase